MEFTERKLVTELIICLGLLRDKKRVYNYKDVRDFLNLYEPEERNRFFYDKLYHIIIGRNNQVSIQKTILILLIGHKIKDELYFIFSRIFHYREEEFFRIVIPLIQTFSRNLQIYGGKSLTKVITDDGTLTIHKDNLIVDNHDLNERMIFEDFEYQSILTYRPIGRILFDFSEYINFPFNSYNKLIKWIKSPYNKNLDELNEWCYFRSGVLLKFLKNTFNQVFYDIGGSTKYSYYHLSIIKNQLSKLNYSYSKEFKTKDEIDSLFLILNFKEDLKLLFQLHNKNRLVSYTDLLENLFFDDNQTFLSVLRSWGYPISNFQFGEVLPQDQDNFPEISLPDTIEIIPKREFFRNFWSLPKL
jgi:hypothetical protein